MKKFLFIVAFVSISIASFSQDLISLKRGARFEVIITEITDNLVRYKLYSDPNGRGYFVYKEDVAGIMYQDGRVESFDKEDVQVIENRSNQNEDQRQNQYQRQNPYQSQPSSQNTWSQPSRERNGNNLRRGFSQFHIGLAFPSGKFADGDVDRGDSYNLDKGFAAMGFKAGYKYYSPLQSENLSLVFGIEAFYNGLNSEFKDQFDDLIHHNIYSDITFPMYFNFPVTLGLNFAVPLQENLKLYGEAAIGGNLSLITKTVLNLSHSFSNFDFYNESVTTVTPVFGFTYGLEAGFFIGDKYSIGLRYSDLGSYKYKTKTEHEYRYVYSDRTEYRNETEKDKARKALPITVFSLCFGVLF